MLSDGSSLTIRQRTRNKGTLHVNHVGERGLPVYPDQHLIAMVSCAGAVQLGESRAASRMKMLGRFFLG
jgi:hypothetical protein